jgi:hypothetical protein
MSLYLLILFYLSTEVTHLYILINEQERCLEFFSKGGEVNLKIKLPKDSQNRLIKAANLLKRGFAKWETLPKTTRNITTGVSMVISGVLIPKALFLLLITSVCTGRHMYLNGEVEKAANEIIIEPDEDFGHP